MPGREYFLSRPVVPQVFREIHEAAAHGLPVVATPLLAGQLWTTGGCP
jgi:hypothetical protein